MTGTKIAFLYSEIAGYFMACAESLAKKGQVLIIRWPTNAEAPFEFDSSTNLEIITKTDHSQPQLAKILTNFKPDIVVCSGWMDKDYLKLVKGLDKNVVKVLSLDNHWNGGIKQRIACALSPFFLKRYFSHAWVPGNKQELYAKKLGFKSAIIKGFYCANTSFFNEKYNRTFKQKEKSFPKKFLYVARYVEHKGIFEMWEAFCQLQAENPNEWELWCLGTGDQWDNKVEHEKIKHFGFVQPKEMDEFIEKTGVYILPSKFEPWGVSVQEFAIAGFPLLLSNSIGSKERFLEKNGISFNAGSISEIKTAMKKMVDMSENELIKFGQMSHEIGMSYTTDQWADKILALKK